MEKKSYLILDNEFIQYCKLNNIVDIENFAKKVFNIGFTSMKYGNTPNIKIENKIIESNKKEEIEIPIENKNKATNIYDE